MAAPDLWGNFAKCQPGVFAVPGYIQPIGNICLDPRQPLQRQWGDDHIRFNRKEGIIAAIQSHLPGH
jgi:hypothetical protein